MINSQTFTIRPAATADADDLFRLAGLLATSAVPERPAFDRALAAILADRNQRLLVAAAGGDLVGYLYGLTHPSFHANGPIGWIEELYVDEQCRGTGLGRRLMSDFEQWAADSGEAVYFAVATRRAGEFYRSIGYAESAGYFKKVRNGRAATEEGAEPDHDALGEIT
ncbi:GNAT family N-acetyltransferase [Microlunatus speluncae]|uniref:GNAT family N-acetyltransferase n=1 Tax=Microlunatus speluncae TaxID=2594267 RepID=UPI0012663A8A|nr:GNAT family N-acetyltransferase [Microlunatus speluncae]